MNSWQIIRDYLTAQSKRGTFGRDCDLDKAARLFILLKTYLKDEKEATNVLNADEEVKTALFMRAGIKGLKDAGIIS